MSKRYNNEQLTMGDGSRRQATGNEHVKKNVQGFSKNGRKANWAVCAGAKGHSDVSLRKVEDITPKAGFTVVFHLGEVEVGTRTTSDKLLHTARRH